jgi:phosphoglucosamine mutase
VSGIRTAPCRLLANQFSPVANRRVALKFGTDGIRGVANQELSPELALRLGIVAAKVIGGDEFLLARDTRHSGPMLQAALSAGLASSGATVRDFGVVSTPAIAYASSHLKQPAAMISASHNPFADNGIKFFLPGGKKLSDEIEEQIEEALASAFEWPRSAGLQVGSFANSSDVRRAYMQHLGESLEGDTNFADFHVVFDFANGAASSFRSPLNDWGWFGRVTALSHEPDGVNINDGCGSTHPQAMQEAIKREGATVGFAFDGDADRVLAADHTGTLVDGDQIMALLAIDMKERGLLAGNTLVTTVMSNLGLKIAMRQAGIDVHETKVGDRYVLEALDTNGWSLGGEQSGHVIIPKFATTGDGLLTALQVLAVMRRSGKSLQELASVVTRLPQVLKNVRVIDTSALSGATNVWDEVQRVENELGDAGRVLLRTSGTEPLVRVMVEASTPEQAERLCDQLCNTVERELAKS